MTRLAVILLFFIVASARADTPADCRYEDVVGVWQFSISETSFDAVVDCNSVVNYSKYVVKLLYPNVAVDELGNKGFWTMVYNQGFEVVVAGRKFFAFSKYKVYGKTVTSFCGDTSKGWIHNIVGRNWGCYSAHKTTPVPPKNHTIYFLTSPPREIQLQSQSYFINFMKSFSSSSSLSVDSYEDLLTLAGGRKSMMAWKPSPIQASPEVKRLANSLPSQWDWRNVSGINYVSPVRNQGTCGSCYAFAAMGMLESRLRILTNNRIRIVLSPQDVVECSAYSQGCEGGFPYLIGKYAEDFGAAPEDCNSYKGENGNCTTDPNCPSRYFATRYQYVGGYYGGCNEEAMMIQLVKNGPLAISFEVTEHFHKPDLWRHGGIWRCDESTRRSSLPKAFKKFYPFVLTNHAVVVVGYGVDEPTGQKYWLVKNSWGETWGEWGGYFRIRRGTDECGIESMAVEAFPTL